MYVCVMSREHEHVLVGNKEIEVIKLSPFYCLLHRNKGNLSLPLSITLIPHTRPHRLYANSREQIHFGQFRADLAL